MNAKTLPVILNRDFQHPADGWYMIEAKGEHPNGRAGVLQVIDDAACQSIVNRFNAEAAAPNFPGMLVDHEHFKHDEEKETIAYAWLMRLENRADGIYGQLRWTDTGKKAVDGGDYRFFSTEYDRKDLQVLNDGKPRKIRPMALAGLTLTNNNNNKGQKPITNRGEEFPAGDPAESERQQTSAEPIQMKTVIAKLGLAADAPEADVLAKVTTLLNRNTELESAQIVADLKLYEDRYVPGQMEFIKNLLVTNRAATVEYLKTQPVLKNGKATPTSPAPIHNRATAAPVDESLVVEEVDEEALSHDRVAAIEQYRITNRECSYEQARNEVRRRKPELFGLPPRSSQTQTHAA